MASAADKLKKTSNGGIPAVATVQVARSSGILSLSVDTQQFWPTSTGVAFSTYKVDTNNVKVPNTQIDWAGVSNGTNLISGMVRVGGVADNGNAIGDKVQMGPTAQWAEDLIDGLANQHNVADGSHKAITTDTMTASGAVAGGSLAIANNANVGGTLTVGGVNIAQILPAGVEVMYGGLTAPTGWLLSDGSAVSRSTYANLFAAIGTRFGAGDGTTTFNLPPAGRFRVPMDGSAEFPSVGSTGGQKSVQAHSHGVNDPGHSHSFNIPTYVANGGSGLNYAGNGSVWHYQDGPYNTNGNGTGISVQSAGSGANNLNPYVATNFIIKT
jgi:microcystin-dependent protein